MITLTPKAALGTTPPAVIVFWFVSVVLVINAAVRGEGKPDGECDTYQSCNLKSKILAPESCSFGARHSSRLYPTPTSARFESRQYR